MVSRILNDQGEQRVLSTTQRVVLSHQRGI
jgi:hypothetical protein